MYSARKHTGRKHWSTLLNAYKDSVSYLNTWISLSDLTHKDTIYSLLFFFLKKGGGGWEGGKKESKEKQSKQFSTL